MSVRHDLPGRRPVVLQDVHADRVHLLLQLVRDFLDDEQRLRYVLFARFCDVLRVFFRDN